MSAITDYIPHGAVAALGAIVAYVFREHTKQDDARFNRIADALEKLQSGQTKLSETIATNHSTILERFIDAAGDRERHRG